MPTEWVEVAEVESLFMYPLKSGKAVEVKEAEVTERYGFEILNV